MDNTVIGWSRMSFRVSLVNSAAAASAWRHGSHPQIIESSCLERYGTCRKVWSVE